MSDDSNITVSLNLDKLEDYTEEVIHKMLEACGMHIETEVKLRTPVDTGLLRNSYAHAVSGEKPQIGQNLVSGGWQRTYKSNKYDKSGNEADQTKGVYKNVVPTERSKNQMRVYVGSNVYYAPYVEMGHKQNVGQFVPKLGKRLVAPSVKAQPHLRPAFTESINDCKDICEEILREEMENFNDS